MPCGRGGSKGWRKPHLLMGSCSNFRPGAVTVQRETRWQRSGVRGSAFSGESGTQRERSQQACCNEQLTSQNGGCYHGDRLLLLNKGWAPFPRDTKLDEVFHFTQQQVEGDGGGSDGLYWSFFSDSDESSLAPSSSADASSYLERMKKQNLIDKDCSLMKVSFTNTW